jgi:hypothetical protein
MLIYLDPKTGREAPLPSEMRGVEHRVDGYRHVAGSEEATRADSAAYGEYFRTLPGIRVDSVTSELPGFALSLTARRKQIVEERTRKLNAARLFRAYTEIPVGARKFTIPYAQSIGEAVLYKGSHQIPVVHRAGQEDEFKTAMLVTSYEITDMQQAENSFAQANMGMVLNTEAGLSSTCTKVILDKANELYWFGDSSAGLYGLATYPALPKITSDIAFDGTDSPTDVADELNSAIQYPANASGSTFNANLVVMTERVASYLSRTRMGSIDLTTIMEFVKACNPGVRFEIARELKDLNGNTGYDGILICNDDVEHTCIGIQQGVTFHPPERIGLSTRVIVSMSVGGAGLMPIPGANVLLEVTAPTY